MTVFSLNRRREHQGNGVTTDFNGPRVLAASQMEAYLRDESTGMVTQLALGTDFTVSRVGFDTSIVKLTSSPPSGVTVVLLRRLSPLQPYSIKGQGAFYADIHEDAFDYRAMYDQQVDDQLQRTVRMSEADSIAGVDLTTPPPAANMVWGWDATGLRLTNIPVPDFQSGIYAPGYPLSTDRLIAEKLRESVSVRDFGAIGDGVTNDAPAINAALAYVHARGGGSVRVPVGTYRLQSILRIGSNTSLVAEDGVVYLKDHTASFINNGLGFSASSSIAPYGGHHDILIEGGIWEGFPFGVVDGYSGFVLGFGRNITLRKIVLKNSMTSGHSIDMACCDNVLIEDCQFLGQRLGTQTPLLADCIQLDACVEGSFPYFGLPVFKQNKNITVRRCKFDSNPDNPDPEFGPIVVGVGGHATVYGEWAENITIENCEFNGCTGAGVRVYKWKNAKIINNTFRGCTQSIYVSGAGAGTLSSQDIDRVQTGKGQGCRGLLIQGNWFADYVGTCLFMVSFDAGTETSPFHYDVKILSNNFETTSNGSGMQLRSTSNCRIEGNEFKGGGYAIYASSSPSHTVQILSNTFRGQLTHCVGLATNGSNYQIAANQFDGSAGRGIDAGGEILGATCTTNQFIGIQGAAVYTGSSNRRWNITGNQFLSTNLSSDTAPVHVQSGNAEAYVADNHVPAANSTPAAPVHVLGGAGGNFASFRIAGSPEGVVTAPVGSIAHRSGGGAGTSVYVKETGTGNTGWVAK
jgi:hypothetical protein